LEGTHNLIYFSSGNHSYIHFHFVVALQIVYMGMARDKEHKKDYKRLINAKRLVLRIIGDVLPYQAVCPNLPIEPEPTQTP